MNWLHNDVLGNDLQRWIVALATAATVWGLLQLARRIVRSRLLRLAMETTSKWDDVAVEVLASTRQWFFLALSLGSARHVLELPRSVGDAFGAIVGAASLVQAGIWLQRGTRRAIENWQADGDGGGRRATLATALGFASRMVIWSVVCLLLLQNLGVKITALVAGLGVGGIAVGLALQNVMSDLFASLSIYTDRPFDLGDFIVIDDFAGTVDHIGWRSTRLTSLGGEQLIIFNADITESRIRNFKRMKERRVVAEIGIEYGTPYAKVRDVKSMLRTIIGSVDDVRFDRAHFKRYGDSALVYEIVFYVLSPDYDVFMDKQELVNLEIYRTFEEAGVAFAFPTQTLYLRCEGGG